MCGICGVFRYDGQEDPRSLVQRMTDALAHRGPDGAGTWLSPDGRAALGQRRLSIIDPTGGAQPMFSADRRAVIVFNGEIYNYAALARELEARGRTFATRSDTEVALEAVREWGVGALDRFHGMFALAVHDLVTGRLFLARDHTGIKPLYFADTERGFFFGSELKAVLASSEVPRRLNPEALADFLVLSYPQAPSTFFRHCRELPAGTWMELEGAETFTARYWTWRTEPVITTSADALDEVERCLGESVEEHLVADVEVGALLSAGIDSSLLVALAARRSGSKVKTFTASFAEASYDEAADARLIARHLGTEHHELVISAGHDAVQTAERVLDQFDQPFGDSSAIPTYLLCAQIRQEVKAAISGDGGDEMFGGYPRFGYADVARTLGHMPGFALDVADWASRRWEARLPERARQLRRMLAAARGHDDDRLIALSCYVYPSDLAHILHPDVLRLLPHYSPSMSCMPDPGGEAFMEATVFSALPNDYLRKVDVASSAHGLEIRVPFLGRQVLECSRRLTPALKFRPGKGKLLLRALAEKYLPAEIVRRPKTGFGIPLDSWLGESGRSHIRERLMRPSSPLRSLIQKHYLESTVQAFVDGRWESSRVSRMNGYQRAYFLWALDRWIECSGVSI